MNEFKAKAKDLNFPSAEIHRDWQEEMMGRSFRGSE